MQIETTLKTQALNTLKMQLSKMDRSSKLVILNVLGVSKETMIDMLDADLVSEFIALYAEYLNGLDSDNIQVDSDYYKASMFISGQNKTELKTLIKNY